MAGGRPAVEIFASPWIKPTVTRAKSWTSARLRPKQAHFRTESFSAPPPPSLKHTQHRTAPPSPPPPSPSSPPASLTRTHSTGLITCTILTRGAIPPSSMICRGRNHKNTVKQAPTVLKVVCFTLRGGQPTLRLDRALHRQIETLKYRKLQAANLDGADSCILTSNVFCAFLNALRHSPVIIFCLLICSGSAVLLKLCHKTHTQHSRLLLHRRFHHRQD